MNELSSVVIVVLVCIGVFFVIREVLTWYWKINEIVGLLRGVRHELQQANAHLARMQPVAANSSLPVHAAPGTDYQTRATPASATVSNVSAAQRDGSAAIWNADPAPNADAQTIRLEHVTSTSSAVCARCGTTNPSLSQFCGGCGIGLNWRV